jgi:hypothetical protein
MDVNVGRECRRIKTKEVDVNGTGTISNELKLETIFSTFNWFRWNVSLILIARLLCEIDFSSSSLFYSP